MDALTPAELAKRLGVSARWVSRHQHELTFLELTKAIGFKKYAGPLVDKYLNGERVVNFGAGKLKDRRLAS